MAVKELLNPPKNRRRQECKCNLCRAHKEIRAILRRGDVKELRRTVRGLSECLCNNGEELAIANAYIEELTKGAK